MFRQDQPRTYACQPIGLRRILYSTLLLRYCTEYCISWFDCLSFLRGLCCAVLQLYTPHQTVRQHRVTFAGSSSHNLSTMTSRCVLIITSPRARCYRGSTSSVRVQQVGYTCNSNEVGKSPAFVQRCDAPPMRCGDATAM